MAKKKDLQSFIDSVNIAEKLSQDKLNEIFEQVNSDYETDEGSRAEWLDQLEEWEKLAGQIWDEKSWPWQGASNIKYPLVSVAAIQFNARAFPSLVPNHGDIVKAKVFGTDPDGQKFKRSQRVSKFMSWQLKYDMKDWDEGMDRLLMMLPVCGNVFKKVFYDPTKDKNCSYIIHPRNLVVNDCCVSLDTASRVSEKLPLMTERDIITRQRMGLYREFKLHSPDEQQNDRSSGLYQLIEQHCYLDLDEDGYAEPYIVTFHPKSNNICRIVWRGKEVRANADDEIVSIEPEQFYVKYSFIPSITMGFYDMGFGHLLGPVNEAVNTIINQLVDAGTLANLQAGFMGKGLRIKQTDMPLRPGEFRQVNATGDDLRKQIVPMPFKEPSNVLFQLLGMLVTAGKELASVAEIFVGKMPGQNTPATTTMASIEQGMKVFTAIYRRVYRSMDAEIKRLYELNAEYLDESKMVAVLDEPIGSEDFKTEDYDICPAADPSASSQSEKLMKAQALAEMLPIGILNPMEVIMRILEAQEQPNIERLLPGMAETGQPQMPPQQPDPKVVEMQMKQQAEQAKAAQNQQMLERKMAMEERSKEAELASKEQENMMDLQHKATMNALEADSKQHMQNIFIQQELTKLASQREQAKSKSETSSTGKKTGGQKK
ncbi:hypothetical protein [Microcystis sp. M42BS1]|uniref:portal protein n=1 Tax=Microcystis sp. M42BS1 TaxID=2771192 RepID=UPI00258B1C65|nr:hypothetical protein [Microcystis sp. M42BS1]MCA2570691.1 hypothetical protein [Microcystis sp. M42BS1]